MISAIIVNHNGRPWIERCLDSLGPSSCDDLEIIVVDNASTDGSLDLVNARYPHVSIVRMAHNVGFAVANNLGAVCSRGDTLLLLNHDAWLEPGCLGLLKQRLDTDPGLGLVARSRAGASIMASFNGCFGSCTVPAGTQLPAC